MKNPATAPITDSQFEQLLTRLGNESTFMSILETTCAGLTKACPQDFLVPNLGLAALRDGTFVASAVRFPRTNTRQVLFSGAGETIMQALENMTLAGRKIRTALVPQGSHPQQHLPLEFREAFARLFDAVQDFRSACTLGPSTEAFKTAEEYLCATLEAMQELVK